MTNWLYDFRNLAERLVLAVERLASQVDAPVSEQALMERITELETLLTLERHRLNQEVIKWRAKYQQADRQMFGFEDDDGPWARHPARMSDGD